MKARLKIRFYITDRKLAPRLFPFLFQRQENVYNPRVSVLKSGKEKTLFSSALIVSISGISMYKHEFSGGGE